MSRKNMHTGLALGALLMFLGGCTAGFQSVPINELEPGPEIPYSTVRVDVKPALAEDVTQRVHGDGGLEEAQALTNFFFSRKLQPEYLRQLSRSAWSGSSTALQSDPRPSTTSTRAPARRERPSRYRCRRGPD